MNQCSPETLEDFVYCSNQSNHSCSNPRTPNRAQNLITEEKEYQHTPQYPKNSYDPNQYDTLSPPKLCYKTLNCSNDFQSLITKKDFEQNLLFPCLDTHYDEDLSYSINIRPRLKLEALEQLGQPETMIIHDDAKPLSIFNMDNVNYKLAPRVAKRSKRYSSDM